MDESWVIDLGGEVVDKSLESMALVGSAQVFKGMWEPDVLLKESVTRLGNRIDGSRIRYLAN